MKLELEGLTLFEAKVVLDCLTAFRAGLPFSHPGRGPQLMKDARQEKETTKEKEA